MEEKKKLFHVRVSYVYIYIYIYNLIVITGKRDLIRKCLVVNMDKLQKISTLI